jgi:hypothetical protein
MVINALQEKIIDSFTIREKITNAFADWFKALAVPPAPPPPEEEQPAEEVPEGGA